MLFINNVGPQLTEVAGATFPKTRCTGWPNEY